jgi:hypothetical protein
MLHNEKGFTFPLSLCMLLLISTFVVIYTQQYLNEKKFAHETETILKQEYYFLVAVRKLETQLQNDEPILNKGQYIMQKGRMDFTKEDLGTTLKFNFSLTLSTGEKAIGIAYYNKIQRKMIKWVEKN